MAVQMLMIASQFPNGVDTTTRSTVIFGQLLPYNTANPILTITAFSITTNVVTFTVANTLTAGGGQSVIVAGFEGAFAYLNGAYTTTAATSTTFSAALTAANAPTTPVTGLATLNPNYTTGGTALGGFVSVTTGKTKSIGTIGPLAQPKILYVYSLQGTRNYPVNMSVQPPMIMNYTLAGVQATTATAFPTDSIGFEADFVKGGF